MIVGIIEVVKPLRILVFLLSFYLWMAVIMLVEGGHSPIRTLGGTFLFALGGALIAYCGFSPILSERIRSKWCRADADFGAATKGLALLGLIGSTFAVGGLAKALAMVFSK